MLTEETNDCIQVCVLQDRVAEPEQELEHALVAEPEQDLVHDWLEGPEHGSEQATVALGLASLHDASETAVELLPSYLVQVTVRVLTPELLLHVRVSVPVVP